MNNIKLKRIVIIFSLIFSYHTSYCQISQSLRGTVNSKEDSTVLISQVTVTISETSNSEVISYAFTNNKGFFDLKFTYYDTLNYFLVFSHLGYLNDTLNFNKVNIKKAEIKVYLKKSIGLLKEVIVKSNTIIEKNDTIEYKADSYKTAEVRKVKDLLNKMDGFAITENGKITYQGKQIKALLINGDDLTQEQYEIISNNLNANNVDAIQVFDNYSKNKVLGSFYKSGEVAINLKIKKRFEGKWSGSTSLGSSFIKRNKIDASLIYIKPSVKFLFFGNSNNISENV